MPQNFCTLVLTTVFLAFGISAQALAQTTVEGQVLDQATSLPIEGAILVVQNTLVAARTDQEGRFALTGDDPLPWSIVVRVIGYKDATIEVEAAQSGIEVSMSPPTGSGPSVSALGRVDRETGGSGAPALLFDHQVKATAVSSQVQVLEAAPGTYTHQFGTSNHGIVLRGSPATLTTTTQAVVDYRPVNTPLGALDLLHTPLGLVDVKHAEIIRGPGSALFGPDVTSGVVHFVTKDPFEFPGTSVELTGGERSTLRSYLRHAGHSTNQRFGYKVNLNYWRGKEWDFNSTTMALQEGLPDIPDEIVDAVNGSVVANTGGVVDPDNSGFGGNLSLHYRPSESWEIVATGGGEWYEGAYFISQGEGYREGVDAFVGLRASSENFFAQLNTMYNPGSRVGGRSFLYRSGKTNDIETWLTQAQLQYSTALPSLNSNVIAGLEYQTESYNSNGAVFGRYENKDGWGIASAVLQTETLLTPKLSLVLAARADHYQSLNETTIAPRFALVYSPDPSNTIRLSANRAYGSASALFYHIDFPVIDFGAFQVWGLGGKDDITFGEPATTSFIPGVGVTPGVGMPLSVAYALVVGGFEQSGQVPASFTNYLKNNAGLISGFSDGKAVDVSGHHFEFGDEEALGLESFDQIELGYKGVINSKLAATLEVFGVRRQNVAVPHQISPLVELPTLPEDMARAIEESFDATELAGLGLTPAQLGQQFADILIDITRPGGEHVPLGLVATQQTPSTGKPNLVFGYQSFGEAAYVGLDAGLTYFLTGDFALKGSVSLISENEFIIEDLHDGEIHEEVYRINLPKQRGVLGFNYFPEFGFYGDMSFRYEAPLTIQEGVYSGPLPAKYIVNGGAGYRFTNGIQLSVSGFNLFDHKYSVFPGLPIIGRQVLGKVLFEF